MHIVILGNGISGITCARFLRKLTEHEITVISAETDYFFSRTALMYIYMGHMQYEHTKPYEDFFWKKNRIKLVRGYVNEICFEDKTLHFDEGQRFHSEHGAPPLKLSYDKLVLATGSASNKFGWPGQELESVEGLYSYQDLTALEKQTAGINHAVIVGGGLIGIELAEMLHSRNKHVSLLVREKSYWSNVLPKEESAMINQHILDHGIELQLEEELAEIVDNGKGACGSITTKSGKNIVCEYVGLTAGVHPNVKWLKDGPLEINKGILVNKRLETNIKDVYAIGDCAEQRHPRAGRRPVEAIWYTGRMMGETAAHVIAGINVAYDPGVWFNSAKFLDIEYQVYGEVPAKLPDHLSTLYWQHESKNIAMRINFNKSTNVVVGFNVMGMRMRHEVCEKWIKSNTQIEEVLENLALADFNPEFYAVFHSQIVDTFNDLTGKKISVKSKRSLSNVFSFLNQK